MMQAAANPGALPKIKAATDDVPGNKMQKKSSAVVVAAAVTSWLRMGLKPRSGGYIYIVCGLGVGAGSAGKRKPPRLVEPGRLDVCDLTSTWLTLSMTSTQGVASAGNTV